MLKLVLSQAQTFWRCYDRSHNIDRQCRSSGGYKLFLTVTAVECSAKYAANIKVGSGTLCAEAIQGKNRIV